MWRESILRCADNSGVAKAYVIGIHGNRHGTVGVGDKVRLVVREKSEKCKVSMPHGLIVRSKQQKIRKDGSVIKFDDNAFVIISRNKPRGTAIIGPVLQEVQHSVKNLASAIL